MTQKDGLRSIEKKCSFEVLFKTIPSLIGSIDGLQGGVNEARNRAIEAKQRVEDFGNALGNAILYNDVKKLGEK